MKSPRRTSLPIDGLACVDIVHERRDKMDRRRRILWAVFYGSFSPRRRAPQRRLLDLRFRSLDWHAAHLMAVSIGILLLSAADALMTLKLLSGGAVEVNPIMAAVVCESDTMFATVKMALTGVGVMMLVVLARYRFMRMLRVEIMMYGVFISYLGLLGYECWMFGMLDNAAGR